MKQSLLRKSQNLIIWLGVLPLLLASVAYRTSSQHVQSVQEALSTAAFIQQLDELLSTVQDAETGQRGYVLTGEDRYLTPYTQAKGAIAQRLAAVDAAARGRVLQAQLTTLHTAIDRKMNELQRTVDLRRNAGLAPALREIETNAGQQYMVEIRSVLAQLKRNQAQMYKREMELQKRRQLQLEVVLACGVAAGLVLVFLA